MHDRDDRVSSRSRAKSCLTAGAVEAELRPRPKHMLRCQELGLSNIVILAAAPVGRKSRNDAIDHSDTLRSDDFHNCRGGAAQAGARLPQVVQLQLDSRH